MSLFLFPALFLLTIGDPPTTSATSTEPETQPVVSQPAPKAKPAEPKMICRTERVTGSRVAKETVCRPAGGTYTDMGGAMQHDQRLGGAPFSPTPLEGSRSGF